MGIHHSMNKTQVDEVLMEFEATTSAIKGIEQKISRVQGYVKTAKEQRETMSQQAEDATSLIDSMTGSMNTKSEGLMQYFTETLDFFADLMEALENTIMDLQLLSAPRELQRELGPLLVPAVVLVMIITVSNCVFGFLLAGDEEAAGKITLDMLFGGVGDEDEITGEGINILKLFAVVHVVLIAIALLYLICESGRRQIISRNRRRDLKLAHREQHQGKAEVEQAEMNEEYELTDDKYYEEDLADEGPSGRSSESDDPLYVASTDERVHSLRAVHGQRVNRQILSAAGDSSPLSDFSGNDALDHMARHQCSEAEEVRQQQNFNAVSPSTSSPAKSSSRRDKEDIFSCGSDASETEPSSRGAMSSPWSTSSQRMSPAHTASSTTARVYRKTSDSSDTEQADRQRQSLSEPLARQKHMRIRAKARNSATSSGSREFSPPRGGPSSRGGLSIARVPKIQISSVLRKVQQKAQQVTKEGVPRTREAIASMDPDAQHSQDMFRPSASGRHGTSRAP